MEKRGVGSSEVITSPVAVNEILFIQASIRATFKDGRSVDTLIEDLKSGKVAVSSLPPLRVLEVDGQYLSFDTRRLYCIKQSMKYRTKTEIQVVVISEEEFFNSVDLQNEFYNKLGDNVTKLDEVRMRDGRPWFEIREGERHGEYIYVQDKKTYISQLPKNVIDKLSVHNPEAAAALLLKKGEAQAGRLLTQNPYELLDVSALIQQIGIRVICEGEKFGNWAEMIYSLRDGVPQPSKEQLMEFLLALDREKQITPEMRARELEARRLALRREMYNRFMNEDFPPGFSMDAFGIYSPEELQSFLLQMDAKLKSPPISSQPVAAPRSRLTALRGGSGGGGGGSYYSWAAPPPTPMREMHDGQTFSTNLSPSEVHRHMSGTGTLEPGHGAIADRPIVYLPS